MLLHAAYVDANLRGDATLAQLIPGFLDPDNKDFLRAMVKLLGDYGEEKIPAAHLLDIVSPVPCSYCSRLLLHALEIRSSCCSSVLVFSLHAS